MGINQSNNVKQISAVYELTTESGMRIEVFWVWCGMEISSWDLNISVKHLPRTNQSVIDFYHLGHIYTVNVFSDGTIHITRDGVFQSWCDIHQFLNSI